MGATMTADWMKEASRACDRGTALCPRCGGHGGWIEDDGQIELEIDCPMCDGYGYATAAQLAQALKDEWQQRAAIQSEIDEARAAVGGAWLAGESSLAEAIRLKTSFLERIEDTPWPPRRGLLRQRDARWHYGTWLLPGLAGGGRGSVDVWRAADGSCLVGAMVEANMTPEQAEMLAQALQGAAAKARAEDAGGVLP